jgi:hypothetical protein
VCNSADAPMLMAELPSEAPAPARQQCCVAERAKVDEKVDMRIVSAQECRRVDAGGTSASLSTAAARAMM